MKKENKNLHTIVASVVFVILAIGLIGGLSTGTLSGFGYDVVSALCPLGAFTTMIATKTMVPRAVISIVVMALLVLILGRTFCGWICPIPVLQKIGNFFKSSKSRKAQKEAKRQELQEVAKYDIGVKTGCGHDCKTCPSKAKHGKVDSRHAILAGALGSSLIFGFPVFCLICPVGLSFATVILVWRLFAFGDTTWSIVFVIVMLVLELTLLRKWCTRFCPLSALMNLVSRFGKFTLPTIDNTKCIESTTGKPCSLCAQACEAEINLRHPEFGERTLADCTRCRACVTACPTKAVSMPLVSKHGIKGVEFPSTLEPKSTKVEEA